jgi:YD repeat-containing protein
MKKILLTVSTLMILFLSCTKESLRTQGSEQLKKVIQRTYAGDTYTLNYSYDTQNRLTFVKVGSSLYTWRSVTEIQYDAQGRLSKALHYQINDSNVVIKQDHSYTFVYNSSNQIIRKIYTALSSTTNGGKDHAFGYDAQGRLTADTTLADQNGGVERFATFIYDNNNNVIEERQFFGNGATPLHTYLYTYDNKRNPFLNIPDLGTSFYFVSYSTDDLSANNLTRRFRAGDEPTVSNHEYSPSGQLTKSLYFPENHPQFTTTFEYFYN